MSASGGPDKAGDLRGKSMGELLEILERQEKLVNNKRFIAKLPDRGKKILDYAAKVRLAIVEHEELKRTTELLSAVRLEFQANQNNVTQSIKRTATYEDNISSGKQDKSAQFNKNVLPATANSLYDGTGNNREQSNSTEMQCNSRLDENITSPMNKNEETPRNAAKMGNKAEISCLDAEILVTGLEKINLEASNEETVRNTVDNSTVQEKKPFSPRTQTKPHYIEVLENRSSHPLQKNDIFRPNQLPSGSNCSSPSLSPGGRKPQLSQEERRARDNKHIDEMTSARIPPLHYKPTQLLPLEESLALQLAQKQSYEENQGKLAAERLAEKLNIKMETFNPEGDSYMKYRDIRDDENHESDD
ncbi:hypothetical protein FKM82_004695 [Ascaphus truei]